MRAKNLHVVVAGLVGLVIGSAGIAGAAVLLMSRPDKQQQQVEEVSKTLTTGLGVISTYPGALGRMQAELNLYQSSAKQLTDNHSQAAHAEIAQIQRAIRTRRSKIAAMEEFRAQRQRALSISMGRNRADDLDRVMKLLLSRGESRAQATRTVAADGILELRSMAPGQGRVDLAKDLVKTWASQIKTVPEDANYLMGLTPQVLPFLNLKSRPDEKAGE